MDTELLRQIINQLYEYSRRERGDDLDEDDLDEDDLDEDDLDED